MTKIVYFLVQFKSSLTFFTHKSIFWECASALSPWFGSQFHALAFPEKNWCGNPFNYSFSKYSTHNAKQKSMELTAFSNFCLSFWWSSRQVSQPCFPFYSLLLISSLLWDRIWIFKTKYFPFRIKIWNVEFIGQNSPPRDRNLEKNLQSHSVSHDATSFTFLNVGSEWENLSPVFFG